MNNPVSAPPAAGYVERLLGVLADNDPLAVQRSLVDRLRAIAGRLDHDALHRPEAPGKWSIAAVVRHLADNDIVHGYRMRKIIGGDRPSIEGYDENAWARELGYLEADYQESIADLAAIRGANLRMLARLTDEQWARTGLHNERGEESVRRIVELIAAHDLVHLAQAERIAAAVG